MNNENKFLSSDKLLSLSPDAYEEHANNGETASNLVPLPTLPRPQRTKTGKGRRRGFPIQTGLQMFMTISAEFKAGDTAKEVTGESELPKQCSGWLRAEFIFFGRDPNSGLSLDSS